MCVLRARALVRVRLRVRVRRLEALERDAPGGQAVGLGGRVARVRVRQRDAEALHPLLGVLAVLRLQYQRLVPGEYLERLRDVAGAARHLHGPDLIDVDTFAAALRTRDFVN